MARLTSSRALEMRPPLPRLGLIAISGGLVTSGQERRTFKFSCIWLHFVAFLSPEPSSSPSPRGRRDLQGPGCEVPVGTGPLEAPCPRPEHPHPMLRIDLSPIQGEVNTCLRGNDGGIRENDSCRQCTGWHGGGAMGNCREVERWADYALSLGVPDAGVVIVAWNIRWFTWRLAWQR